MPNEKQENFGYLLRIRKKDDNRLPDIHATVIKN